MLNNHNHDYKFAITMFFVGLITFFLGLFLENPNELISTVLFLILF